MSHRPMRILAALLVTATLVVPGAALATTSPAPPLAAPVGALGEKSPADPAAQKVSREQAITLARNLFGLPKAMGEPDVSLNQGPGGASWFLQFHEGGPQPMSVNITIGVDAETGAVVNYSKWTGVKPNPAREAPAFTRAEAEAKAQYWLAMLAPTLRETIKPVASPEGYGYFGPGAMTYAFRWNRVVQGYPSRPEGVSVVIDARTGELQEFNRGMWGTGNYKLPASLLPKEKAEAAYRQVPMQLSYQRFYQRGVGQGEWHLVYRPATEYYPMVDQSGKLLNPSGQPVDLAFLKQAVKVPVPAHPWQPPARELTRAEALAMAKQVTGLTEEPSNASYQEAGQEQEGHFQGWMFDWQLGKGEVEQYSVQIDVVRGVLTTFNHWGSGQPLAQGEKPKLTEEAARGLAVAFVRASRPDLGGSLVLMPNPESRDPYYMEKMMGGMDRQEYNFNFQLLKNGVPVMGPNVNLTVDARTGQVRNFWAYDSLAGQEFPSPKAALTPGAAMDAFLKQPGLELNWVQPWAPPMPGQAGQAPVPQLMWTPAMPEDAYALDAMTGALLDYQGRDLLEAARRPSDIEGHFAQREIELLWTRGVVELDGGKFSPEQVARVGDVVRWLVLARGMAPYPLYDFRGAFRGSAAGDTLAAELAKSPSGPYLGAALQAGIILPEDVLGGLKPDAAVSRQQLALWTARAMGYGAIVRMPNRIELPFADRAAVGAWYANAVGLLSGLGAVKGGPDAMFEPQRAATRGEAAKMIFAVALDGRW
jgi:hypothetical protein